MKKSIISLLVALCATASFAQSSLLATLSHEGEITSYYGTNALKEAYNAAMNGDVITLSSGLFNAVNINKAITVRGAGMAVDSVSGSMPTVISGEFSISAPEDSTDARLILEGLYHNDRFIYNSNIKNAQIIKCRFRDVGINDGTTSDVSISFIQCRVDYSLLLSDYSNMTCINSYIHKPYSLKKGASSNFDMQNCVIYLDNIDGNWTYFHDSRLINCIIVPEYKPYTQDLGSLSRAFSSSNTAYNSIAVGNSADKLFWGNMPNTTNKAIAGYDMFITWKGTWNDDADFILTDEAVKTYLGTDGTQVGIYGGMMPYETTPSNPQITKFNVASKSSADGKLSVDIQVGVAE